MRIENRRRGLSWSPSVSVSRARRWWTVGACTLCAWTNIHAQGAVALAVPGRSNENVSVAANGQFVTVVWSASTSNATDIFSAVSTDGGAKFGAPVRVNAKENDARAGGEQPPRVVLVAGKSGAPEIAVVWTAKGEKGTKILTARSKDGGKTYGATSVIPGGEAAGNRGWEAIAVNESGKVFALWLDHRNSAPAPMAPMHEHGAMKMDSGKSGAAASAPKPKADPNEKAGLSQVWFGALDGSVPARSIASSPCYCCKTSLVASGASVYAVWRHVFAGNQRDIAMAVSRDGGKTFGEPVRVSEDKWQFDGCPENGPAIAAMKDGSVQVAWVTPEGGKDGAPLALYTAGSADGKTFTPRARVSTAGAAGHVQISAASDGSLLLAWDEVIQGSGRRVRLAHGTVDKSGRATFKNVASPEEGEAVYPTLAATAGGTVVAWVSRRGAQTSVGVARVK